MSLLLLNEDELRQTVTIAEAIQAVESAFAAVAQRRMNEVGAFKLDLPQVKGKARVKGAHLEETPYYFVKVNNSFYGNSSVNLPVQTGLVIVFDAATGCPAAILVDNGYLSQLRAGAAGALAARYLANEYLERVAVIGSGNQAYIQLKSLMAIRQVGSVSVWDRSPEQADSYARLLVEDHDLDMEIAPSIEAAASQADLIITATASRKPLLRAEWLKPGVHITAVGSDEPGKQELYPEVLQQADIIVVDSYEQCAVAGELCHALAAGLITRADVRGELADLVTGQTAGRTRSDEITVADLTGLDLHDAAIASLAVEKALFLGLGQRASGTLC